MVCSTRKFIQIMYLYLGISTVKRDIFKRFWRSICLHPMSSSFCRIILQLLLTWKRNFRCIHIILSFKVNCFDETHLSNETSLCNYNIIYTSKFTWISSACFCVLYFRVTQCLWVISIILLNLCFFAWRIMNCSMHILEVFWFRNNFQSISNSLYLLLSRYIHTMNAQLIISFHSYTSKKFFFLGRQLQIFRVVISLPKFVFRLYFISISSFLILELFFLFTPFLNYKL